MTAGEAAGADERATVFGASQRALVLAAAVLICCVVLFVRLLDSDAVDGFRSSPGVAAVALERAVFDPGVVRLDVRNEGRETVVISQVAVNGAYWTHTIADRRLGRLESTRVEIPYPWTEGVPVSVELVTDVGDVVVLDLGIAVATPPLEARTVWSYAVVGLMIGIIPVSAGLCVLPVLRTAVRSRWFHLLVAATVGMLVFLAIDTLVDGLELSTRVPAALGGVEVIAASALVTAALLTAVELRRTQRARSPSLPSRLALGIGLHNLGEGLAVGGALATGESRLGLALLIGFAVHNLTEGVAIAVPFAAKASASEAPSVVRLAALAAVAGLPAVAGTLLGGLAYNPTFAAIAFGIALGAVVQVTVLIGRTLLLRRDEGSFTALGVAAGCVAMYLTGLLV